MNEHNEPEPAEIAEPETFGTTIEPVGKRILFRKDKDKETTRGGLILPHESKIPQISGRIVAVSAMIENDLDYPLKMYDRVIVNGYHAIPVNFESDNDLFLIPIEDVVAVYRKG